MNPNNYNQSPVPNIPNTPPTTESVVPTPPAHPRRKILLAVIVAVALLAIVSSVFAFWDTDLFSAKKTSLPTTQTDSNLSDRLIAKIPENLIIPVNEFDPSGITSVLFTKDGKQVMYVAFDKTTNESVLMHNDKRLEKIVNPNLLLSESGLKINYWGYKVDASNPNLFKAVINGVEQQFVIDRKARVELPHSGRDIVFSDDGNHYAYLFVDASGVAHYVYDNVDLFQTTLPKSPGVYIPPVLSSDGKRIFGSYADGSKAGVVVINVDTKQIQKDRTFDRLTNVYFDSSGSHYAYTATDAGKTLLVVDGTVRYQIGSKYGVKGGVEFSLDGKKILFVELTGYGYGKEVVKVFDLTVNKEVAFNVAEFGEPEEYAGNMFLPTLSDYTDNSKKYLFSVGADEVSETAYDPILYKKLQESRDPKDMIQYYSLLENILKNRPQVNNLNLNKTFASVSLPSFDEKGQNVSFGVRENREFRWKTFPLTGTDFQGMALHTVWGDHKTIHVDTYPLGEISKWYQAIDGANTYQLKVPSDWKLEVVADGVIAFKKLPDYEFSVKLIPTSDKLLTDFVDATHALVMMGGQSILLSGWDKDAVGTSQKDMVSATIEYPADPFNYFLEFSMRSENHYSDMRKLFFSILSSIKFLK